MGNFENLSEQDESDVPWDDGAIRAEYEAALGAFILAFNEIDYWAAQLLRREMGRRDVEALYRPKDDFGARLKTLIALAPKSRDSQVAALPFDRIKKISEDRNLVAHGHFDQNPFDGKYSLVRRHQVERFPTKKMLMRTQEARAIADEMRGAWYVGEFGDVPDQD